MTIRRLISKIPRFVRLSVGLVVTLSLVIGGLLYVRRSGSLQYGCLQVNDLRGILSVTFDVNTSASFGLPTARNSFASPGVGIYLLEFSPNGKYLAYTLTNNTNAPQLSAQSLWVKSATASSNLRDRLVQSFDSSLNPGGGILGYHWLPDGERLISFVEAGQGSTVVTLTDVRGGQVMSSPLANYLVFLGPSADGAYLAFQAQYTGPTPQLVVLSASDLHTVISTPDVVTISPTQTEVGLIAWAPHGHRLAYEADGPRGEALMRLLSPGDQIDVTFPLPDQNYAYHNLQWSPDGRYLLAGGYSVKFDIFGIDGTVIRRFTNISGLDNAQAQETEPTWSVDGHSMFYSSYLAPGSVDMNLMVFHFDDQSRRTLAVGLFDRPNYAPDFKHLLVWTGLHDPDQETFGLIDLTDGSQTILAQIPRNTSDVDPQIASGNWHPCSHGRRRADTRC